jgi:hypothetical protein
MADPVLIYPARLAREYRTLFSSLPSAEISAAKSQNRKGQTSYSRNLQIQDFKSELLLHRVALDNGFYHAAPMHNQNEIVPYEIRPELTVMPQRIPILFTPTERSRERFWDFFTSSIRNRNTRIAYYKAIVRFADWCEAWTLTDIARVRPINIATYIEQMLLTHSKPTVKQHLAAIWSARSFLYQL